jgi:hypothetical protein
MKYLLNELERKLRNAQEGGLIILPLSQRVEEEIKEMVKGRFELLREYYGNVSKPDSTLVINPSSSPSLLVQLKRVILWESSEEYMRKMRLSFKLTNISVRNISPRIVSKERIEIISKVYDKFRYPVIPPNEEEGRLLSERGVEVVNRIQDLKYNKVILARQLKEAAYILLRSKVIDSGHLVDLTETSNMNEDWEKVRMAEAGVYGAPSIEEMNGFRPSSYPAKTKMDMEGKEKEVIITPRKGIPQIKLIKNNIYIGNIKLFEYFTEFNKISIKGRRLFSFDSKDIKSLLRITMSRDTVPFPTLTKDCETILKNRTLCTRISAELALTFLSLKTERRDLYAEVSKTIRRDVIREILNGNKKKYEMTYLGKKFFLVLEPEGEMYISLRGECEGGRSLKSKIKATSIISTTVKSRKIITQWIRSNLRLNE